MKVFPLELALARDVQWADAGKTSPLLLAAGVRHGFNGVGDEPPQGRHAAKQVHGTRIVTADIALTGADTKSRVEADGVLTTSRGVRVAVKTADCLPVLLIDAGRTAAVAVHAGWRGLAAGILQHALQLLEAQGVPPARILVAVGPAIGREAFEVGFEVVDGIFGAASGLSPAAALLATAKGQGDRWHVDLQLAAVLVLLGAGIGPSRLEVVRACTRTDPRWHSYRREGKLMGSNWAWVEL